MVCVCVCSTKANSYQPVVLGHLHHEFGHLSRSLHHGVILPLLSILVQLVSSILNTQIYSNIHSVVHIIMHSQALNTPLNFLNIPQPTEAVVFFFEPQIRCG